MGNLRYVVMSDLHLGAGYSVLTDADEHGNATPAQPSPTLRELAAGFRTLLPRISGDEPPTLVLLGDIFDLSFASPRMVVAAFQRLLEEFFAEPGVFNNRIIYVPGNHDHREWRIIRDHQFLESLRHDSDGEEFVVTGLSGRVASPLCTAAAQSANVPVELTVESGYPNLGFRASGNAVVMHHGHFTEGTYRLMDQVVKLMSGTEPARTAYMTELLNGPWMDFGWSNSGDQGLLGPSLFNVYEMMQDPAATHDQIRKIATALLERASTVLPVKGSTKISAHGFEASVQSITEALLDVTVDRAASNERRSVTDVLSPGGVTGVKNYLAGPVRDQLDTEGWLADLTTHGRETPGTNSDQHRLHFIFGHTHKPFQDAMIVPGYARPVHVWNTGGWVVDHPGLSPAQGGAAVLVDDDANVASLRLFTDPLDGSVGKVRAEGAHAPSDAHNPLLAATRAALGEQPTAWDGFSQHCLAALEQRARLLRGRFFDAAAHPPVAPRGADQEGATR